ncbi:MAG: FIST N-terminal domain-containing protein, partial [Burkholderiales bacterium]
MYRALDADWPEPLPRHLDGPDTLVLAFGPRALLDAPAALHDLARAFPHSVLMGCSTAGEITAAQVGVNGLSVVVARFDRTPLRA